MDDWDDDVEDAGVVCSAMEFWGRLNGFWMGPCELTTDSLGKEVQSYLGSQTPKVVGGGADPRSGNLFGDLEVCFGAAAWKLIDIVRVWELKSSCRDMLDVQVDVGGRAGASASNVLSVVWSGWRRGGRRCVRILHPLGDGVCESPLFSVAECMHTHAIAQRGGLMRRQEALDGHSMYVLLGKRGHLLDFQEYCSVWTSDKLGEHYERWSKVVAGAGDGEWRLRGDGRVWTIHYKQLEVLRLESVARPPGVRGPCWVVVAASVDVCIRNELVVMLFGSDL